MFTNTEDDGKYLESYGAVEGVFVWSQSASFLGCLAHFAQRAIQIGASSGSSMTYLNQVGSAQKFS